MNFLLFFKKIYTKTNIKNIILAFFVVGILVFTIFILLLFRPAKLTSAVIIHIPDGYSIIQTGQLLESEDVVSSGIMFRIITQLKKTSIKSGSYLFEGTLSLFDVVDRIERADYGDVYISLTIPEGSTNEDILDIAEASSLDIDMIHLRKLLNGKEGFLFPDTYALLPSDSEEDFFSLLENTFNEKFQKAQESSPLLKTIDDIVTMASIVEKEAGNNLREKQMVAGILWKRLDEGMRLQVDAPFLYERQKGSAELTRTDLQTDSPYNTYTRAGLTPTPIGNPGYDALYATMHPIDSPYYFYLHAPDGQIYYAQTYDGHLKNIRIYLR